MIQVFIGIRITVASGLIDFYTNLKYVASDRVPDPLLNKLRKKLVQAERQT